MPLLLIHFARFGPYHDARLRAAADVLGRSGWEVIGLETAGNDSTYAWEESEGSACGPRVVTAFPGRVHEEITAAECRDGLLPLLDALQPDAIAIAGWASPDAQACLKWCRKHGRRRIVMSETREADGRRVWWKELIKRYLISGFDGALVGGKSQRDYLVKLGMAGERIRCGYNVVDNAYFAAEAETWRGQGDGIESNPLTSHRHPGPLGIRPAVTDTPLQAPILRPYFLASNRFIERKNLARLIEAYAAYALRGQRSEVRGQEAGVSDGHRPPLQCWNLCLLGDGELKPDLIAQCHRLGLQVIESAPWESDRNTETPKHRNTVFFPGFRQIEELPRFYAHAGCFVHPAFEEPWGLVINEAMACGLPVLSGNNVGAAEELVEDGVNGWKFDAENVAEMAQRMVEISAADFPHSAFGAASLQILEERSPTSRFGTGLGEILKIYQ